MSHRIKNSSFRKPLDSSITSIAQRTTGGDAIEASYNMEIISTSLPLGISDAKGPRVSIIFALYAGTIGNATTAEAPTGDV